jgi:regulator of protease activity HflC (stomatin/prohibitin superfamily)
VALTAFVAFVAFMALVAVVAVVAVAAFPVISPGSNPEALRTGMVDAVAVILAG